MELTSERRRSVPFQRPPNRWGIHTFCFFLSAQWSYVAMSSKSVLQWADVFVQETGSENNKTLHWLTLLIAGFPFSKWGEKWRIIINPGISPLLPRSLLTLSCQLITEANFSKCTQPFQRCITPLFELIWEGVCQAVLCGFLSKILCNANVTWTLFFEHYYVLVRQQTSQKWDSPNPSFFCSHSENCILNDKVLLNCPLWWLKMDRTLLHFNKILNLRTNN